MVTTGAEFGGGDGGWLRTGITFPGGGAAVDSGAGDIGEGIAILLGAGPGVIEEVGDDDDCGGAIDGVGTRGFDGVGDGIGLALADVTLIASFCPNEQCCPNVQM